MDIQLKRGLLDVCVLAAIQYEDGYGYQIIKDIHPYVEISESTLYPILRRMENAGLLTVRTAEHNGRLRKYYHITQAGLDRLEAFRQETPLEMLGVPAHIVDAMEYLAGAEFVTGQVLGVNGGYVI